MALIHHKRGTHKDPHKVKNEKDIEDFYSKAQTKGTTVPPKPTVAKSKITQSNEESDTKSLKENLKKFVSGNMVNYIVDSNKTAVSAASAVMLPPIDDSTATEGSTLTINHADSIVVTSRTVGSLLNIAQLISELAELLARNGGDLSRIQIGTLSKMGEVGALNEKAQNDGLRALLSSMGEKLKGAYIEFQNYIQKSLDDLTDVTSKFKSQATTNLLISLSTTAVLSLGTSFVQRKNNAELSFNETKHAVESLAKNKPSNLVTATESTAAELNHIVDLKNKFDGLHEENLSFPHFGEGEDPKLTHSETKLAKAPVNYEIDVNKTRKQKFTSDLESLLKDTSSELESNIKINGKRSSSLGKHSEELGNKIAKLDGEIDSLERAINHNAGRNSKDTVLKESKSAERDLLKAAKTKIDNEKTLLDNKIGIDERRLEIIKNDLNEIKPEAVVLEKNDEIKTANNKLNDLDHNLNVDDTEPLNPKKFMLDQSKFENLESLETHRKSIEEAHKKLKEYIDREYPADAAGAGGGRRPPIEYTESEKALDDLKTKIKANIDERTTHAADIEKQRTGNLNTKADLYLRGDREILSINNDPTSPKVAVLPEANKVAAESKFYTRQYNLEEALGEHKGSEMAKLHNDYKEASNQFQKDGGKSALEELRKKKDKLIEKGQALDENDSNRLTSLEEASKNLNTAEKELANALDKYIPASSEEEKKDIPARLQEARKQKSNITKFLEKNLKEFERFSNLSKKQSEILGKHSFVDEASGKPLPTIFLEDNINEIGPKIDEAISFFREEGEGFMAKGRRGLAVTNPESTIDEYVDKVNKSVEALKMKKQDTGKSLLEDLEGADLSKSLDKFNEAQKNAKTFLANIEAVQGKGSNAPKNFNQFESFIKNEKNKPTVDKVKASLGKFAEDDASNPKVVNKAGLEHLLNKLEEAQNAPHEKNNWQELDKAARDYLSVDASAKQGKDSFLSKYSSFINDFNKDTAINDFANRGCKISQDFYNKPGLDGDSDYHKLVKFRDRAKELRSNLDSTKEPIDHDTKTLLSKQLAMVDAELGNLVGLLDKFRPAGSMKRADGQIEQYKAGKYSDLFDEHDPSKPIDSEKVALQRNTKESLLAIINHLHGLVQAFNGFLAANNQADYQNALSEVNIPISANMFLIQTEVSNLLNILVNVQQGVSSTTGSNKQITEQLINTIIQALQDILSRIVQLLSDLQQSVGHM